MAQPDLAVVAARGPQSRGVGFEFIQLSKQYLFEHPGLGLVTGMRGPKGPGPEFLMRNRHDAHRP